MTKTRQEQAYVVNPYNNSFLLQYFDILQMEYQYIDIIRTGVNDRLGINKVIRSKNLYVNHRFSKNYINAAQEEPDKENLINFYDVIKQHQRLVVLGDPGIGKTTMVSRIATIFTDLISNFPEAYNFPIPFPITLRDFNFSKQQNFKDFLKNQYFKSNKFKKCKPDWELIKTVLKAGQAFIIFDGIDEISNKEQRKHLAEMILELFEQYPDNKVWFTSRILGFDLNRFFFKRTEGETMEAFKEELKKESIDEFWNKKIHKADLFLNKIDIKKLSIQQLYLPPFTDAQISQFAQFWAVQYHPQQSDQSKYAKEFTTALNKHIKIKALARIPFLLTMMSLYFRINRRFPDGRVQLYKQIAKVYLDEMRTRSLPQFVSEFTLNEQMVGLSAIAYEMQKLRAADKEQSNIIIDRADAEQFFKQGLEEFGLCANKENVDDYIKTYFDSLNKRSEILIPKSESQYAFIHLSYQEYFAAEYWYRRYQKIKSTSFKENHQTEKEALFNEISEAAKHDSYAETIELFFECFKSDESNYIPDEIDYVFNAIFKRYYDIEEGLSVNSPYVALYNIISNIFINEAINLETLHKVKTINIWGQNQIDYEVLAKLQHLKVLHFDDATFNDLGLLVNLEKLEVLSFIGTKVKDLNPLKSLEYLEYIEFYDTPVQDLNPLTELKNLRVLSLKKTQVSDLNPLKDLTNLTYLSFGDIKVNDLSPLKDLTKLTNLSFYHTKVSDLSPLKGLMNLTDLSFSNTKVSDLSPLKDLTKLTNLSFYHTKVSDLNPLKGLMNLTELFFDHTKVSDLSPLKGLMNLTELFFDHTKVSDLSPLKDLTNLTCLFFHNTQVSDLSPLKDLTKLATLLFDNTKVSDLSPLKGLTNLTNLHFANTQVSDLSPLKDLTKLELLFFQNTKVSDLSPLKDLKNLWHISCPKRIDTSPLKHLKNLHFTK